MGGAVSSGQSNAELVDNLCREEYIQTPAVERAFRAIDRAEYMTFRASEDDRLEAYEDHAWRRGTLHLSAPCIYTRALEALRLSPGLSFLNIGSGTGYFSTLAGLLLGGRGTNHGIEIYPENVEYAYERLEEFRQQSPWYDPASFCEPLFVAGNGLLMGAGRLYDRVYCGAACPPQHVQLMKNLLNDGGILVMPHDNQLESIVRRGPAEWEVGVVLPSVSFAPLILPSSCGEGDLAAVEISTELPSLKQCSRLAVLHCLTRSGYCHIPQLPLPSHLKDYVCHYRDWASPPPPLPALCPLEKKPEEEEEEACASGTVPRPLPPPSNPTLQAHHVNLDGRRVLLCNFNGIMFQVPMDSDEDGSDGGEGEGEGEGEGRRPRPPMPPPRNIHARPAEVEAGHHHADESEMDQSDDSSSVYEDSPDESNGSSADEAMG